MQPGRCCNEITKFSLVKTTPSRQACRPLGGQPAGYRRAARIAGSIHQRLLAGFANAAAACSCLQLPARDAAAGLAWGRIPAPPGLEGVPSDQVALGAGPEGWMHRLLGDPGRGGCQLLFLPCKGGKAL